MNPIFVPVGPRSGADANMSNLTQLHRNRKTSDVADAQRAVDDYPGANPNVMANLVQALTDAQAKTQDQHLADPGDGAHAAWCPQLSTS